MVTKAEAAAIAYHAIHDQFGDFVGYEDEMRSIIDVIEILQVMADTEYKQYIDRFSVESEQGIKVATDGKEESR